LDAVVRPPRDVVAHAARAVENGGRQAWHHWTLRTGVDVTAVAAGRSCLVLAPHPDDETLGCGATIALKRANGTPVRVVVAADGRTSHPPSLVDPDELARRRAEEVAAACRILGVAASDLVQLGFEDQSLDAREDELVGAIAEQLDAVAPDEVRLPSTRDWHPDHRALGLALRRALSGRKRRPAVFEHPVWLWVHGPWEADPGGPWAPRNPVAFARGLLRPSAWSRAQLVSTAGLLDQKRRALLAHHTQTANPTGDPAWVTFDQGFVASFLLPYEIAFPLGPA
jgi:LmbE family N-acetylglucosaminyl deacetylase